MAARQDIGKTLLRIVRPNMTPKQLMKAAKKAHPKAGKQDIVRAASYATILNADADPEKSKDLQDFAITQRALFDDTMGTLPPATDLSSSC